MIPPSQAHDNTSRMVQSFRRTDSYALFAFHILALVLLCPSPSRAQTSEYVEVVSLADLDFGAVAQNAGVVEVFSDYPLIGRFTVRAKLSVPSGTFPEVDLTLVPTSVLSGGSGGGVTYAMAVASNSQSDDPFTATTISGTNARISLQVGEGSEDGIDVFSAFVYVFGAVTVLSDPAGPYVGSVTLFAEAVPPDFAECNAPAWDRRERYDEGDLVTHENAAWIANRFTIGVEPGIGPPDLADHDTGQGEPGGGLPWDLVVSCD